MVVPHITQDSKIVCADMSSKKGSVTLAVKPDTGVVVTERVCLAGERVISGIRLIPSASPRKPPARTYAVIRNRAHVSLQREEESEARTRHIDTRSAAFGSARIGFTKLKKR
jgi:hypothetical protein